MPDTITATEYLEVNAIALATPAYRVISLAPLLGLAPTRGQDLLLPYANGRVGRRRRLDEQILTFGLHVMGQRSRTNTIYTDPQMGLVTNSEYLKANLGVAVSGITVPAIWHRRDGTTKTANVIVQGLVQWQKNSPTWAVTTFDLVVPAGAFT